MKAPGDSGAIPQLRHSQAEAVGAGLHDLVERLAGEGAAPFPRDALTWADLVQFVLRRSAELVRDEEDSEQENDVGESR